MLYEKILLIDGNPETRTTTRKLLQSAGCEVDVLDSPYDFFDSMRHVGYNLVFLDASETSIVYEILKRSVLEYPECKIIVTGSIKVDDAVNFMRRGAFDCLPQPIQSSGLCACLENCRKSLPAPLTHEAMKITALPLPDMNFIKILGGGSMAVVVMVERKFQYYALKMLREELRDDKEFNLKVKRFMREAELLTELNHPNIIKAYRYGISDETGLPYILLEFVDGVSLSECMLQNIQFSLEKKLNIIAQIASALEEIHNRNIVHRDIKPKNVLIRNDGVVKLSDFGVAYVKDSSLTGTYEILGSPSYMPPEAFSIRRKVDRATDIFSLGILSYEFITGEKAFTGTTIKEVIEAIRKENPRAPSKIIRHLDKRIQYILGRMIHKDPGSRYASARELLNDLNSYLNGEKEPLSRKLSRLFSKSPWK